MISNAAAKYAPSEKKTAEIANSETIRYSNACTGLVCEITRMVAITAIKPAR
ncbi:hypothetical protein D3C79_921400 [compost metagenome]